MWLVGYNVDMSVNLSQSELTLLAYLHDHAGTSGERVRLDPKPITRNLRIGAGQFAEDSACLAGHGLAGVRDFRGPDGNEAPSSRRSAIWLTGKGEDYLRRLAAAPGVRRRITVAVVTEMGASLRDIAAEVLTDFIAHPR
jgi:hypothetical protein